MALKTKRTLTFEQWKSEVAIEMQHQFHLHPDDIPDYGYADAYDDGETVNQTVVDAVKAAQTF